jgi:putative ABC transport system permease protein
VWVRDGRAFEPGRADEAIHHRSFALANGIEPGDRLPLVIEGRERTVAITGLAESPEFVFGAPPGELLPDASRFAVVWMATDALAPMVNGEGTFDDVVLGLQPGADIEAVVDEVDELLAPYGGAGAVRRKDQPSAQFLDQEMAQLRMLSLSVPVVFLGVGAFLLQIVLSRIVELQRTQIATLKAFGYSRAEIAAHFLAFVSGIGVVGAAGGLALGVVFGRRMVALYAEFFHLPLFSYQLTGELVLVSVGASLLAATVGGIGTVLRIAAMEPAEAMQPAAPPSYTRGPAERLGLLAPLGPVARIAARDLVRHPLRLLLSVLGIAFAAAVVVLGRFANDSIGDFVAVMFDNVQAEDVSVAFAEPVPRASVVSTLGAIPGVTDVETQRLAPARFSWGHRARDGLLVGYGRAEPRLRRLLSYPASVVALSDQGIVLTDVLADLVGTRRGGWVDVEALFGGHARGTLRVADVVREPVGLFGHLSLVELGRLLGEDRLVNQAYLSVDDATRVMPELDRIAAVLGASRKDTVRRLFDDQTASTRDIFVVIATAFGAAMAVGIVYNNARIALSRRSRELASLRVLGFTRGEVGSIVLGELGVQVALGVPLGLWLGKLMGVAIMSTVSVEMWRFPITVMPRTYAWAIATVAGATVACAALVRRHVARLDLVGVLKTRE